MQNFIKTLPWAAVVALTLAFGWTCRQQALAEASWKADKAKIEAVAQDLHQDIRSLKALNDSLQKENATRRAEVVRSHKRELVFQGRLDSLKVAIQSVVEAPPECGPWVQGLTVCEQIVTEVRGQRDSLAEVARADSARADSNLALAKRNRAVADSLLKKWPKPSWFKDLTNRGSAVTFIAGLLAGILASK